jgi:hypothetical protein
MAVSNTYTAIATQTLSSAVSSVTFSSIPSTYTDLIIIDSSKVTSGDTELQLRFNGDTAGNYSGTWFFGDGASAYGSGANNTTSAFVSRSATGYGLGVTNIQNYSNSTTYKTVISRGNSNNYVFLWADIWRNTAAITSLTISTDGSSNFTSGSTFTLFGIKAA